MTAAPTAAAPVASPLDHLSALARCLNAALENNKAHTADVIAAAANVHFQALEKILAPPAPVATEEGRS